MIELVLFINSSQFNIAIMKNILFYIIAVILFCGSCKKDKLKPIDWSKYYFNLNEITQRDSVGNLIGTAKPNDWTLMPISQATDFDKHVFSQLYNLTEEARNNPNTLEDSIYDLKKYNQNCTDTFTFKMIAYPNPLVYVYPTQPYAIPYTPLHLDFQTNLHVKCSLFTLYDRFGTSLAETYAGTSSTLLPWFGSPPSYERDFILYYIIYTQEGCVYFGHGNVIGAQIKE